jgi:hypothetical protein
MSTANKRSPTKRKPTPGWVDRSHISRGRKGLSITLPDAIYARVQRLASTLHVSRSRVIELALDRDVFSAEQLQLLQSYHHHLPRIGANLNQLARFDNTDGSLPGEAKAVLAEVNRLVGEIGRLLP